MYTGFSKFLDNFKFSMNYKGPSNQFYAIWENS